MNLKTLKELRALCQEMVDLKEIKIAARRVIKLIDKELDKKQCDHVWAYVNDDFTENCAKCGEKLL